VTAEKIISDMKNMDPMDAMKEANKVLKKEGKYKNLQEKDVKRIMDDTNDFIFGRDIPEDPEGFAVGGRVGMASGGIAALKTLIRFLGKDSGKKGSKMLKEINPKQFGYKFDMLDPEMKNAINKNRLEYLENLSDVIKADKKLLREMKDLPKEWQDFMYKQANEGGNKGRLDIYNKINIDDAIGDIEQMKKNLEFKDIPGKEIQRKMNAEGGSQGLDYLMGIERRGYAGGGESMVSPDDDMLSYEQAVEKNRQEQMGKNALASQKFDDFLKEKTGYANIDDYYQDPERLAYDPTAAEGDITKGIYDAINLEGYKPYGYEDTPFQFEFDKDPNVFSTAEYDDTGREVKRTPISSEAKQQQIKNYLENALYDQSLLDPNRFGFSKDKPTTIEGSKFFLDQLKNLQKRDPDFEKVIKEGKYIDALENKLRNLYDPGEYQKLQETLDPGYSKYAQDNLKINKAFDTSDVLANYEYKDGQRQPIDSSIYGYLSNAERDIIERSQSLPTYLTGYAQQLIQDARNRKQAEQDRREQLMSPDDSMNQDIDATNAGIPDSNLFQKGLTALTPAAQLAKGILGIGGTPITQSMETALQDIIQNQIKETGNLSGDIDYNDYGVQTSSGAEYLGLGDKSITDPKAALALTLGRASYAVDPQTGKVNLTGGTDYNFEEDQLPFGLGTFINKGGIRGFLGLDAKEATQYAPNISVNPNYIKQTYQDIAQRQLPYMQQYQQDYQNRRSQVDPNALNTQYLQKLQNPNATNMDQFKSQLQSNLTPTPMNTGGRVGYAGGGRKKIYDLGKQLLNNKKEKTFGGLQINMSDAMDDARLMKEMGLQGGKPGDYDKFLEMKLSGELGPQKQMQTIKMELFNRYSNFLDDATMDLVQSSNNPQKVAEVYANVKEASILRDRGLGTEEIVDTIVNTPRTKQADGTRPQGLNYLMGY
jgi:hypothetical protein